MVSGARGKDSLEATEIVLWLKNAPYASSKDDLTKSSPS